MYQNKLIVKKSSTHGYGVFAGKTIKKGDIIEECYIIICTGNDRKLENYYFDVDGKYAIFTGFGIVYNHAEKPRLNATYTISKKRKLATIKAKKTIRKGEEIFISYGSEWFETRNFKPK